MGGDEIGFGRFRLDLGRRELSRDGAPVRLGSRAMDILCVLAAAKGEIVSKDELLTRVWPGLTVEENNLQVQISALRKALDEDNGGQSHLVTVPGRGYRLVGFADMPPRSGASRQAVDRGAAVPEHERRPGAGLFRRRHRRGHHHGAVPHPLAVRDRAQFELRLQGPRRRREAGRPRAGRALRARRRRAQGGAAGAHHRAADRRRDRRASVGRPLRRQPRRHLRSAGSGDRERRRRDLAEAGAGRDRAGQAQADRKPRCLRLFPARAGQRASHDPRRHQRGAAAVRQGDRARSRFRLAPWRWRRSATSCARSTAG